MLCSSWGCRCRCQAASSVTFTLICCSDIIGWHHNSTYHLQSVDGEKLIKLIKAFHNVNHQSRALVARGP